ncbi:MAG TPA: outer membrane beta-barrel protein [Terriglobia bacterium]|nr:outer membrane beta-barrel protein [Terriglobia bacterium]
MVRTIVVGVVLLFVALPAFAQEDFPRVEMSLGYANLAYPCCKGTIGQSSRHSGFASTQGLNMTKNLGIENYFAYYGLGGKDTIGSSVSMIANIVGGKIAARTDHAVPYFVAGIGVGYLTDQVSFGQSSFGTRFGPGVDIKVNESMSWKVEFTRLSFHQQFTTTGGSWSSGWNLSTGIVFALSY